MAARADIVTTFLDSLKAGAPKADLLTEDAAFQALNVNLSGRAAVLERMSGDGPGRVYREAAWQAPEPYGEALKVRGELPPGSPSGGAILTVHFDGDRIATIQSQALAGTPRPPGPLRLTPTIKAFVTNALRSRHPMVVSYVDETGQPVVSFRGSTQALDDDKLAIWVRNPAGAFLRAIRANPKVALMYRDEDSKATYQFQGRARVATDEATRETIYSAMAQVERDHDFARAGVALVIDLDLVQGYAGLGPNGPIEPVRMARGAGG